MAKSRSAVSKDGNRWDSGSKDGDRWKENRWEEGEEDLAKKPSNDRGETADLEHYDYITDKSGLLIAIEPRKGMSRFLYRKSDGSETELKVHDPTLDFDILSKKNLREQVLLLVSGGNVNAMLRHGKWEDKKDKTPIAAVGLASKGGTMDYAVYYIHASFGHSRDDMSDIRNENYEEWDNLSGFVWFVDQSTKAYNAHDAGNFLWGYTMHHLGFKLEKALSYANKNESGNDAGADQRAITEGFQMMIKSTWVQPGDLRINAEEGRYFQPDTNVPEPQPMLLSRAMRIDKMNYDL
jgi:hypothetical protein